MAYFCTSKKTVDIPLVASRDPVFDAGELDGNEFGQGECVIYMYGPDADVLYGAIEPAMTRSSHAQGGFVIKRYGKASDSNAREVRIQL